MGQQITTARLDLLLIGIEEMIALNEAENRHNIFSSRTFLNPFKVLTGESIPHENRIADVRANPENIKWYYRLIVERESGTLIGSTSFHAPPDSTGMVEIGIGIAPQMRNLGYATEAITGMWNWAKQQPAVSTLRYTVSPTNLASMAIIARFGFPFVGTQIDPEDGEEYIYELAAALFVGE